MWPQQQQQAVHMSVVTSYGLTAQDHILQSVVGSNLEVIYTTAG